MRKGFAVTQVVRWQDDEARTILSQAAEALRQGRLVALPAETVYLVAARAGSEEAVARLAACDDRPQPVPLVVALSDAAVLKEWVPDLGALGERLARRCWPGMVTLAFPAPADGGRAGHLSEAVRRRLSPQGLLGFYVPGTDLLFAVVQEMGEPLLVSAACRGGEPAASSAEEVVLRLGEEIDLVVDTGPTEFRQEATVLRVEGDTWGVLRPGVVPEDVVAGLLPRHILFVCTGNTCRSPLAEGLCKKLLADRLGCAPAELPARGYVVHSAGLAAVPGERAAEEAVRIALEFGADLSGHLSRPVTPELLTRADVLVAMTRQHLSFLGRLGPLAPPSRLLSAEGGDIDDPLGGTQDVYRACARQIWENLQALLPELNNGQGSPAEGCRD
jgi:protein-tyrosine phosphatase